MNNTNFQLILAEPSGVYAIPDIIISDQFETAFSIQSAADISQRKDNLSKNITFPGTANNNRIFNNLFSLNRQSDASLAETLFANYSPNIGVRAVLYENNTPIMSGDLKINDIARDKNGAYTFTGIITGNRVSFFGKIKDVLLKDLPAFDKTITYEATDIFASWVYSDDRVFFYPQIDYGKGIAPNRAAFDIRNFRPAVYVRQYIKQILASQGYKYVSQFIDSDYFRRAFVPFNLAEFGNTIFGDIATGTGATYTTALHYSDAPSDGAGIHLDNFTQTEIFSRTPDVQIQADTSFTGGSGFDFYGDLFTINKFSSTAARASFNYSIKFNNNVGYVRFRLVQIVNGKTLNGDSLSSVVTDYQPANTVLNGSVSLSLPYGSYDKGFSFAVFAETFAGFNDRPIDVTLTSMIVSFGNPDATIGSSFAVELGDTYNLKNAIPQEQKAAEFLRSVLQFFNMYMIENPDNDKELIIEPYDTFYNRAITPALNALDWSKKVDQDSLHIKINTALPKAYNFKFKPDGDYYNTLYTNTWGGTYGDFSIDNRIGTADAKPIEVIFSPTIVVKESGDDKTFPAIYDGTLVNKKSIKSNIRILFNNTVDFCQPYDLVLSYPGDPVRTEVVYPNVAYCQVSHHVLKIGNVNAFNLLFGLPKAVYYQLDGSIFDLPTLYTALYENQINELNSENLFTLEIDVILREADVSRLDLRTPIFLSTIQGSAYFKIMSLTYYNRDEPSKAVLQKVIL